MMNFYGCHNVNFLGNTTFVVYNPNALETFKKNKSIKMCTNFYFFKLQKKHIQNINIQSKWTLQVRLESLVVTIHQHDFGFFSQCSGIR
jgi:hypothetical protein